ncbi:hypothetical protein A0J48_024810 [Sphaerospermopsis aphanizomenoides BCCUSP55]|uniref:hypothetical protein n=1 Tax=Sphaerospermopsis aphanizomenoides TaxID=459663 RepID=UPI0019043D03|nr:hypothetical protein [Sphaerospermopsis aphanizomenoides]MBK1990697.1 hypothetical protein [Sphaerospermopsis aphanizomenoides BCCUSP55]
MLSHLKNNSKLSQSIVITLALAGLLTGGLNIAKNNTAVALPRSEQILIAQNTLPSNISATVLRDTSLRSGVKIADLKITQATATTFGNRCMFEFKEACTREYRPIQGWVVLVAVKGQSWTYHVSQSGQIVIDPKIDISDVAKLSKPIANKVIADAANRAGVPKSAVKITRSTQKIFSNSCVFNFGEVCTQQYDPVEGWEIIVKVRGESWTYHVDKFGSQIVIDPKVTNTQGVKLPEKIAQKVLSDAYKRSNVQTVAIKITRSVQKTFGNACEFNFGEICTQQFDPIDGWEVVVRVNNEFWTYHVDRTGSRIALDPKVTAKR